MENSNPLQGYKPANQYIDAERVIIEASKNINDLPNEVLALVFSHLNKPKDIKNLKLISSRFQEVSQMGRSPLFNLPLELTWSIFDLLESPTDRHNFKMTSIESYRTIASYNRGMNRLQPNDQFEEQISYGFRENWQVKEIKPEELLHTDEEDNHSIPTNKKTLTL